MMPFHVSVVPSGFYQLVNGYCIKPKISKPTLTGLKLLCDHYSRKYNLSLLICDCPSELNGRFEVPTKVDKFQYLKTKLDDKEIWDDNKKPIGVVLICGQNHAIPVLLSKIEGVKYMVIFDSTPEGIENVYKNQIATLFPEYKIFLNEGSRQLDTQSSFTESLCILKDALRYSKIAKFISEHRVVIEKESPSNFNMFSMPLGLCKTAQSSRFVDASQAYSEANKDSRDFDIPLTKKTDNIDQYRELGIRTISFNGEPVQTLDINYNLYTKALKHAILINRIDS